MHRLLLGIEHLMTGIQLREELSNLSQYSVTTNETDPAIFTFHQESPSVVRIICDKPFEAYWPHAGYSIRAVECTPEEAHTNGAIRYNSGEAEWWAQVAGESLRDAYNYANKQRFAKICLTEDYREYKRHHIEAEMPGMILPDKVIRALRKKHGKHADRITQTLTWSNLNKCWVYTYDGVYLGVEEDGYIHS